MSKVTPPSLLALVFAPSCRRYVEWLLVVCPTRWQALLFSPRELCLFTGKKCPRGGAVESNYSGVSLSPICVLRKAFVHMFLQVIV